MSVLHGHLVEHPASDTQRIVDMYIDNMPAGGGTPDANSVTAAMLQNGAVTAEKVAPEAVGDGNLKANAVTTVKIKDGSVTKNKLAADVLPQAATKEALGTVKQAALVADAADGAGENLKNKVNELIGALKTAGIMANAQA